MGSFCVKRGGFDRFIFSFGLTGACKTFFETAERLSMTGDRIEIFTSQKDFKETEELAGLFVMLKEALNAEHVEVKPLEKSLGDDPLMNKLIEQLNGDEPPPPIVEEDEPPLPIIHFEPKIDPPPKTEKIIPPARPSQLSVASSTSDVGEIIFGKKISGAPIAIDDIKGEMKSIVIEGFVCKDEQYGVKLSTTKSGIPIVTFGVADASNGIACKHLFKSDRDKAAEIVDRLKKCRSVRVKGTVKDDDYAHEKMLMFDSIEAIAPVERVDNAEVKRVELHAHTTMSMMDAVVPVEKLIETAAGWGWDSIAVTDHGVVQAFPEAAQTVEKLRKNGVNFKVIYGMEGYLVGDDYQQKSANHIILLAQNQVGLENLYKLVSLSNLKYLHYKPRIPKKILADYRDGLILGSACEAGELIRAITSGASDEKLLEIAAFYDYLEIQPIHNNDFLKRSTDYPDIETDDDLRAINRKVAELAKQLDKPLIATCDVHYLNREDAIYRAILQSGKGFTDPDKQPPIYLRTTDEMLAEFDYLGRDEAYAAVVTNPRAIADRIEFLKPIPDGLYAPSIPGADDEIRQMTYARAKALYGDPLPSIVEQRIEEELRPIINHGFAVLYLIAQKLVKKSNDDGYLVGSRGSVGSSLVATLTGITEVNPLPPHWHCPKCLHSEFITDGSFGCGYDLPDKICPECGSTMMKDGHDIPFAVFLGFDGDKVPDIDLNFSGVYQSTAHKYTEILFGKHNVYRAGSITTVADKTAYGLVKKYYEGQNLVRHNAFISHMVEGVVGVKRTSGQHPAGIMVVPRDLDIHYFTPIQHPADDKTATTITTHFDYHSISSRLVKLDILGHDDPTVLKMLEELTGIDPTTIPLDDKETMSIFSSTKALGVKPDEIGNSTGTFGIPEFRTSFTRQMIDDTLPKCFSDLVRISGFSHGTDVWLGNAQELIRNKTCTLKDAISARDDIMMYLIHHGVDRLLSFKTMEGVRKGKGIKPDVVEELKKHDVPDWYIESCQKIKYLFPRAHATAYVMMAFRIAYCKVHHPLAYYAAYFSIRAEQFDANVVIKGKKFVLDQIRELEQLAAEKNLDAKGGDTLAVLQLVNEMFCRGFGVRRIDLYKSDAYKFIVLEDGKNLLPPIASLAGVGPTAAQSIVDARANGAFSSIEDMKSRTGITRTAVAALREHGTLDGMSESDQIELF